MLISLAILLLVNNAFANGMAVSEIPGNSVIPIEQSEIRLLKEKVTIIPTKKGTIIDNSDSAFDVTAIFLFENTSSKKVAIQMGFPFTKDTEPPRRTFLGEKKAGVFTHFEKNFVVKINGKETKVEKKSVGENIKLKIGTQYDHAFVWEVTFNPREKKEVRCFYDIEWDAPDPRDLSRSFRYITKTGALWKNNIKEASFYIKLGKYMADEIARKETELEIKPKGYKLTDNRVIEWTFKNWKPKEDIEIRVWDIRE